MTKAFGILSSGLLLCTGPALLSLELVKFGNMTRCITNFSDVFGRLILFPDFHCGSCGDAKVDLIGGCCGWAGIYWLR